MGTALVRDVLTTVSAAELRRDPEEAWNTAHRVTVLHCLLVIVNEGWEHHRYAVRDLDALEAGSVD